MSSTSSIEETKQLLVKAHEAFAQADLEGLVSLYAPDCTFIDTNDRSKPWRGRDGVRAYAKEYFYDGLSEIETEITLEVAEANCVIHEGYVHAIHSGDLLGYPATGNKVEWHFCAIYITEDGAIKEEHLYYDPRELPSQLAG